jgi:hypothetical protein
MNSALDIDEVKRLYEQGLFISQIAERFSCSYTKIYKAMVRSGIKRRNRGYGAIPPLYREKHPNWKGDNVSYKAAHIRVKVQKGKASTCECCGRSDDGIGYEWSNLTGNLTDLNDYASMCKVLPHALRPWDDAVQGLSKDQME